MQETGGLVVMADSFGQSVFKESFRRVFARYPDESAPCDAGHLKMGFAATVEVLTSREYKARQDFAEHFFGSNALALHSYGPDPHSC